MRPPPTSRGRGVFPVVLAALLLLVGSGAARAQSDSLEYAVKATYLYKFAPFIEWPRGTFPRSDDPFVLCIAGDDPFGDVLDRAVTGQRVGEHQITIARMAQYDPGRACHILYAMGSDAQAVAAILQLARGLPVLTVTDAARGSDAKGIIHFLVLDNRVRFEIDDRAAATNNLRISSKLLSLAVATRPRL